MAKTPQESDAPKRPEARLAKGFRDIEAAELRANDFGETLRLRRQNHARRRRGFHDVFMVEHRDDANDNCLTIRQLRRHGDGGERLHGDGFQNRFVKSNAAERDGQPCDGDAFLFQPNDFTHGKQHDERRDIQLGRWKFDPI